MKQYVFNSEQLVQVLDETLDLFMEYQFKWGFEEPRAREEAIREIVAKLARTKRRTADG